MGISSNDSSVKHMALALCAGLLVGVLCGFIIGGCYVAIRYVP